MTHHFEIRVYYEDTDLAGIVYYANYLKFIERGRTEMLRASGVDQMRIKAETGVVFAVRGVEADFLKPAFMDDVLVVETKVLQVTAARIVLTQRVLRGEDALFSAQVTLAALGENGRPQRVPAELRQAFQA